MGYEPYVQAGDQLRLLYTAAVAPNSITGVVTMRNMSGTTYTDVTAVEANFTTGRAQTVKTGGRAPFNGIVVDAQITGSGLPAHGQFFANLEFFRSNVPRVLVRGYISPNEVPVLGTLVNPGPEGGAGLKENRVIVSDAAPADIQATLAQSNALRRVDGFIWYYHCSSDVASRTLRVTFRDPGDGLPTGMTSGANTTAATWPSAAVLTLTANEEGMIYVNAAEGKIGFAISVDNGSSTFENPTTNPDPVPYWVHESDTAELFFDVTDEEAADRHTIYIIQEEWLQV